jgi:hypothetical protein
VQAVLGRIRWLGGESDGQATVLGILLRIPRMVEPLYIVIEDSASRVVF